MRLFVLQLWQELISRLSMRHTTTTQLNHDTSGKILGLCQPRCGCVHVYVHYVRQSEMQCRGCPFLTLAVAMIRPYNVPYNYMLQYLAYNVLSTNALQFGHATVMLLRLIIWPCHYGLITFCPGRVSWSRHFDLFSISHEGHLTMLLRPYNFL